MYQKTRGNLYITNIKKVKNRKQLKKKQFLKGKELIVNPLEISFAFERSVPSPDERMATVQK
jgi:hypothetical protein